MFRHWEARIFVILSVFSVLLVPCFMFFELNPVFSYFFAFSGILIYFFVKRLKYKDPYKLVYTENFPVLAACVFFISYFLSQQNMIYLNFIFPLFILNEYIVIQTKASFVQVKKEKKIAYFGILSTDMNLVLSGALFVLSLSGLINNFFQYFLIIYTSVILTDLFYRLSRAYRLLV